MSVVFEKNLTKQCVQGFNFVTQGIVYFGFEGRCSINWASLVAQTVKNPLAVQETCIRSLGWEDPLEESTATHSSILAWRIPWKEEPGGLQSVGLQRVRYDLVTKQQKH